MSFWKDLLHQCKIIGQYADGDAVARTTFVTKALGAIISGTRDPLSIWRQASSNNLANIPSECYDILTQWSDKLPKDSFLLGEVYERMALSRKVQGLYYTPPPVIDFILEQTVKRCDIVAQPKIRILDPACGAGHFLLKAYNVLWEKYIEARPELVRLYPESDWSDAGTHRHIITYNLWGADIDPQAAEIASMSLLLKRPGDNEGLAANIVCCDSLRSYHQASDIKIRSFWTENFHYVIGNPPYLSFGLRGGQKLDPEYREFLRAHYRATAEYKLSYYALFLQRGIDVLANGGRLGFILPDSFLLGRYYSKIRRYILANTTIDALAHINANVFKKAAIGYSAVCILQKEPNESVRAKHKVSIYKVDEQEKLNSVEPCCRYEQSYFDAMPHKRFRIYYDLAQKRIIDKIDRVSKPLGLVVTGHTGVRSITRQQDIVARQPLGPSWQRALVSGSQLYPYGFTYEGHWLNINPELLYKGGWSPNIVNQKKILVRQTGYNLVAAIDEDGYYHLNNIHAFVNKDQNVSLEYVLMLLNSKLFSFYYHVVSLEYGRVMAQTDIESLELLPFRWSLKADRLARQLVRLMSLYMKQNKEGDCVAKMRASILAEFFNRLIYRVYELTDEEIKYVESAENALRSGQMSCRKNSGTNH